MAYEFTTEHGPLRLEKIGRGWVIEFAGQQTVPYPSIEAAVAAVAEHTSGLPVWDKRQNVEVSPDILDWRPTGSNL